MPLLARVLKRMAPEPLLEDLGLEVDQLEDLLRALEHDSAVPIRTAEALLERDTQQLSGEVGAPAARLEALKLHVALACCPARFAPPSADDCPFDTFAGLSTKLLERSAHLPTGSPALDRLLGGGVGLHEFTEVVGRSGSGKSQLAMSVAVSAALLGFPVLVLSSTNSFRPRRAVEIARNRKGPDVPRVLDLIRVVATFDIFDARNVLDQLLDDVRHNRPGTPRLVIVDSVAALAGPLLGGERGFAGQALMAHLAAALTQLTAECVGVLVTNEVRGGETEMAFAAGALEQLDRANCARPALGRSWTYVPSIRVQLSVNGPAELGLPSSFGPASDFRELDGSWRTAVLCKHSYRPTPDAVLVAIGASGLQDAPMSQGPTATETLNAPFANQHA